MLYFNWNISVSVVLEIYNVQAIYNEQIITIELLQEWKCLYTMLQILENLTLCGKLYKPLEYIGNIQRYQNAYIID